MRREEQIGLYSSVTQHLGHGRHLVNEDVHNVLVDVSWFGLQKIESSSHAQCPEKGAHWASYRRQNASFRHRFHSPRVHQTSQPEERVFRSHLDLGSARWHTVQRRDKLPIRHGL